MRIELIYYDFYTYKPATQTVMKLKTIHMQNKYSQIESNLRAQYITSP